MTSKPEASLPSDLVAQQVRRWRRQRGYTAEQLAQRCAEVGLPELTAQTISNIETGRRDAAGRRRRLVVVEELLGLALALNVAPIDLIVPSDMEDHDPYPLTPELPSEAAAVRRWIQGTHPIWLTVFGDPDAIDPTVRQYSDVIHEFAAAMPPRRRNQVLRDWLESESVQAGLAERVRRKTAGEAVSGTAEPPLTSTDISNGHATDTPREGAENG